MSADVPPSALARCATHPDELAGATCQRCGVFVCGACTTWVMGALYCPACAARPEVNYLEAFRLTLWGKRDSGAWLVAGCTLLVALAAVVELLEGRVLSSLELLATTAVGVCFFLGARWARIALLLVPVYWALQGVIGRGVHLAIGFGLLFLGALQLFLDTRNRLFFRVDVSERALRHLWDLRVNNPLARQAVSFGVSAFFVPLFAPIAIVCGFIALRRVDLKARPPIGRRGQAIAGIVLGLGALVLWALFGIPFVIVRG
ncbi:DUF4190 domain-containing protein [Myxococcus sp. RHSTA-1-4]|uniref:DUF4190 domain-containing protein n=1 Tax=Myxococcus sp. RHSTA-1-4 TaxID=2874601 RepID=UPI001CBE84D6|nr:DUF4190 domain-containing protein [Myxococcus sp. RHSTA-1-4]MBZ4417650.1 DUF4190 domain-containing protein [Myxococcus sp. RHSTA-1-4]